MKIGILGFGTVGSGVYEIIENKNHGFLKDIHVKKVLVKDEEEKTQPFMTIDYNDLLNDEEISLIVEVIGGIHPAHEFIIKALKAKKHVVTANKAVVAEYLEEFMATAKENDVKFMFEASVGGGIPWIKSLQKAKRIDDIRHVSGIFNGTTNFILDNMYKNDYEFDDILKIAQEKGYAEANPSADIDGIDIQRKIMISGSVAFDTVLDLNSIPVFGIRNVTKEDISYFKKANLILKLIASADKDETDSKVCAIVEPVLFTQDKVEANINDNFNVTSLTGDSIGDLKFYGQGAGKLPTGNAIVQDVLDIYCNECENYPLDFSKSYTMDLTMLSAKYVVRTTLDENTCKDLFKVAYTKDGNYYTLDTISYKDMQEIVTVLKDKDKESFYARLD